MKYEEWLHSGTPNIHDFVEDTQKGDKSQDFGNLEDAYEKFFIYKLKAGKTKPDWSIINQVKDEALKEEFTQNKEKFLEKANQYADIKDPDNYSDLLQVIYKELWSDLVEKEFMKHSVKGKRDKQIASDTMTSAMTRFTDAMEELISGKAAPKNAEYLVIKNIRCIYEACDKSIKGSRHQKWWSTNFSIIVLAFLGEEDRKELYRLIGLSYPCMECFLKKCYQIGNYCPVPDGFNTARSGKFAAHDYWALTLMKIHMWYLTTDKKHLNDLLRDNKDAISKCELWLESFG